jgi:hypothetical protein
VILRSARLDKEVLARLTNAHNFSHGRNLSTYRFLCGLMRQGSSGGVGWTWGALDTAPHLPRLTMGRMILSLERWRVAKDKLEPLGAAQPADRWRATQRLRQELGLPRWIAVADGDNELPIDLDNALSVETFTQLVKDRPEARLDEIPGFDETLPAVGPEGRFVHEIVVPFARVPAPPAQEQVPVRPSRPPVSGVVRAYPPGSEWLYAKLYTGHATADQVLRVRWRGEDLRIERSVGPERIEGEWWRGGEPARDYFKVQDERGRWLWVLRRDGGEDGAGAAAGSAWFVHGLWA